MPWQLAEIERTSIEIGGAKRRARAGFEAGRDPTLLNAVARGLQL